MQCSLFNLQKERPKETDYFIEEDAGILSSVNQKKKKKDEKKEKRRKQKESERDRDVDSQH